MHDCNFSIEAPEKFLKGAGILNSEFLPAWIYKVKFVFKNNSNTIKLCTFTATLGNGIHYLKNIQLTGPDTDLLKKINIIEPNTETGNNNVILFANNFNLSPYSENIITFDTCLFDKYTENYIENSGKKINHESKIYFNGHLIYDDNIESSKFVSEACDYELNIECEDSELTYDDTTKFYIHCKTGQYDMVRGVYIRSILDEGLEFIADSSNLEPKNVYTFDKKTILKWNLGSLQPCEIKRIGFKVTLKDNKLIKKGDILKNKVNSNCINNSTYTQCPSSCEYILNVV